MNDKLTDEQKAEILADIKQHVEDGFITRREARRKRREIKSR